MRNRLTVALILAAGLVFSLIFARELVRSRGLSREGWIDKPVRVLTTAAMVSARGPVQPIFQRFEAEHHVKLDVVVSNDAGFLLERLRAGPPVDLVLGLDPWLLERARAEFSWREVAIDTARWFEAPAAYTDKNFVAVDWSPLVFVYRRDDQPVPQGFDELTDARFAGQFTLADPRATTPGLQFARWVKHARGAETAAWLQRFKPNVKTIAPTWTAGYALFEQKQTRFVWTYLTSLAFHWGIEKNRDYQPLIFATGHPVQVELAAIPADCRECALGETLLRTLIAPAAQESFMRRNFMMPVERGVEAGSIFAELPRVKVDLPPAPADVPEWNDVFTR